MLRETDETLPKLPHIAFDVTKKDEYTPSTSFKSLVRRLRGQYKTSLFKDDLATSQFEGVQLLVFGGPREKFTSQEFQNLKSFIDRGGSILYMSEEGGESTSKTNFNYLLEEYGMSVNSDGVAGAVYYKYFHPKEAYITNGILNRELNRAAGKTISKDTSLYATTAFNPNCLTFVYPFGATINVQKPAVPLLSSGAVSYPLNRPIAGICQPTKTSGKILTIGSAQFFGDAYIEKEENGKICDVFLQLLTTTDKIMLNSIDATEPDVSDYHYLPDTAKLSETIRSCLQESEELPKDFTTLFDSNLFKFDTCTIPPAINLYTKLGVPHEPLTLIQPQFEAPLPSLEPAVFAPILQDIPPPALDLFDLDDHFANEKTKLQQLTAKCTDDDLEYYLRECGEILGIMDKLGPDHQDGRSVLDHVFKSIVNWKKFDQ